MQGGTIELRPCLPFSCRLAGHAHMSMLFDVHVGITCSVLRLVGLCTRDISDCVTTPAAPTLMNWTPARPSWLTPRSLLASEPALSAGDLTGWITRGWFGRGIVGTESSSCRGGGQQLLHSTSSSSSRLPLSEVLACSAVDIEEHEELSICGLSIGAGACPTTPPHQHRLLPSLLVRGSNLQLNS